MAFSFLDSIYKSWEIERLKFFLSFFFQGLVMTILFSQHTDTVETEQTFKKER